MHYDTNSERGAPKAVGTEVMAYLVMQHSHLTFCRSKSSSVITSLKLEIMDVEEQGKVTNMSREQR